MTNIKISVIVPIFNMQKYINRCVESLLNQSYHNLEILLVNDGSTDFSNKIIDDYAAKDNRIIAIHKDNGGIGSAYKAAFEIFTGDYVIFVDCDDWLELNAIENLVKLAENNAADMVHFGASIIDNIGKVIDHHIVLDKIIEGNDEILNIHFNYLKHPTLARLFKRELFAKIDIYEQNIGIDEMLIIQLLSKCNKAVFIPTSYYNVTPNPESVSRIKYSKKKIREGIMVYRYICSFIEKNHKKYSSNLEVKYIQYLLMINKIAYKDKEIKKSDEHIEAINELKYYFKKTKKTFIFKTQPWLSKLLIYSFVIFRPIYHIINLALDIHKRIIREKVYG